MRTGAFKLRKKKYFKNIIKEVHTTCALYFKSSKTTKKFCAEQTETGSTHSKGSKEQFVQELGIIVPDECTEESSDKSSQVQVQDLFVTYTIIQRVYNQQ